MRMRARCYSTNTITAGRVISRDGTKIGYLMKGHGPRVVFVHGSLSAGTDWAGVADRMADRHQVVLVDRRGHGVSEWGRGEYGLRSEAEDVLAVLAEVGPATLVGHSYGAVAVLEAALTAESNLIDRIALYEPPLCTAGPFDGGTLPACQEALGRGAYEDALVRLMRGLNLATTTVQQAGGRLEAWGPIVSKVPTLIREIEAINALGGHVDRYRALTLPVLLLVGTRTLDPLARATQALVGVCRHPSFVTIEGQDYQGPRAAPALVADVIASFVSG